MTTREGLRVGVTDHAVARYRRRVDRRASLADIAAAFSRARFQRRAPGWQVTQNGLATDVTSNAGWLVTGEWALSLRVPFEPNVDRADFVVTTVLVRYRKSKAVRRQLREQAIEDRGVAA